MNTEIDKLFETRKDDPRYNTSYPLTPSQWSPWMSADDLPFDEEKHLSFYIHIPFCQRLCRFCEYVRYHKVDEETEQRYLSIVDNDIANFIASHDTESLEGFDIGGGTPTALSPRSLFNLMMIMNDHADMISMPPDSVTGSMEASFSTITDEKIDIITKAGRYISRLSFGLQNVNADFLKTYNRDNGTLRHAMHVFESCRAKGIKILNIDLMYGFTGQTEQDFDLTLKAVKELAPEHLTLYELRTNMLHGISTTDKEQLFRQYEYLYHHILDMGYTGRFGRNTFSRIGDNGLSSYLERRMLHNGSYKGFGIAAQSKSTKGLSYNIGKNPLKLSDCMRHGTFEGGGKQTYLLPPEEMLAKYIAISGYAGTFSLSIMRDIISANPLEVFHDEFEYLIHKNYIKIDGDTVSITPAGFPYYGAILSLFYPMT